MDAFRTSNAPMGTHRRRRRCNRRFVPSFLYQSDLLVEYFFDSFYTELHVKTVKYFKSIERVQDEVEAMHEQFKAKGGTDPIGTQDA